ncbi:MAG: taurine dioxygenase, partial [Actinobacteria bacterium]|nr:taurine dioxygenase [Actinomycetota bacterium]
MIVEQISAAIGAKVSGIDLCSGISSEQRDEILDALHRHHVLFFENQPLTPTQHRDLAAQ